jgi:hypothetical protein
MIYERFSEDETSQQVRGLIEERERISHEIDKGVAKQRRLGDGGSRNYPETYACFGL